MKKLLCALAVASAGVAFAEDAAPVVESANVVGYASKTAIATKRGMTCCQFDAVDGTGVSIQDFKITDNFREGKDFIQYYDAATKKYTSAYYWRLDPDDEDSGIWSEEPDEALGKSGWGDGSQYELKDKFPAGRGFWFDSGVAATLTISGAVAPADDNVIEVQAGKRDMVGNPYPVETDLQKVVVSDNFREGKDFIQIYDAATKKYTSAYYWRLDPDDEDSGIWSEEPDEPLGKSGWGDGSQYEIKTPIPMGNAFWFDSGVTATLTFEPPVK